MSGRFVSFLVLACVLTPANGQNRRDEKFQLALGLINRGMHDDAARQLAAFVAASPGSAKAPEAFYRLGVCYLEMKKPKDAVGAFRSALRGKRFKLQAECRYRLGHTLRGQGDHRGAAEQFGRLVQESGDGHYLAAPSLFARGESLRELKLEEEALTAYRKAGRLDTDKGGRFAVTSLYQAGFILLRGKEFTAAGKLFQQAADRFPKHPAYGECRFLQGEAALRAGSIAAARGAFQQSLRAGGEFADDAAMGLGYAAVQAKDSQQAVADFRAVIQRFPKSPLRPKALLEAGRALHKSRQFAAAVQQLDPLLGTQGLAAEIRWPALELRGLSQLDLRKPEAAIRDLAAAVPLATAKVDQARIYYSLGEAYADSGEWRRALGAYENCQKRSEDKVQRGEALYGRCLALHRLERYKESNQLVAEFQRDYGDHPLAVTVAFAKAENLFGLKDYKNADRAYGKIPREHKLSSKALFKGAWCSYLAGDFKRAGPRFAAIGNFDRPQDKALAEEALSMEALSWLEAGELVPALAAADRYQGRHGEGRFLARTERVAARVLKRQGKLKLAASRLSRAASVETSKERASGDKLEFAEVLFKQGDFEAAKKAYEPLTAGDGKVAGRAHEGMAWCAFELGEDEECVAWIEKGVKHPAAADARAGLLELLSALHHRGENWAAAEAAARRFASAFPQHPRAAEMRYAFGVALARSGKLAEARQALGSLRDAKVARLDRVFYELAWVCRRSKDEPAAIAAFAKVAEISKDKDLAGESRLHVGEALLAQKKPEAALAQLQRAAGKYEGRAQYLCGFTRFDQKKFAAARRHFERVVKLGDTHPLYFESLFFVGETFFRENDHKAAAERYAILIGRQPSHVRAQVARLHHGQSLVLTGRAREATAVLRDYLRRDETAEKAAKGEPARANVWLGRAWQGVKDHARAEQAFTAVTNLTDDELAAEAQFRIGESRRAAGEFGKAVDAFVKLSILYGHEDWVQRGLDAAGDCYVELRKPAKAKKLFEELIQRFPKSTLARRAQTKIQNLRSQ